MKRTKLTEKVIIENLAELNFDDDILWRLEEGKLTKTFEFKDFQSAFGFMSMCAIYCEKIDHHPEWKNVYNRVTVHLISHDVGGISFKDFDLGAKMDEIAEKLAV
jgi:4a-hydroxytetrahydrobiopterin dehydratase